MAKTIMLQGTSSHVGKSILTAALCRIFLQDGYKTAPFKAQNMALNSYVTKTGLEIGRAQAVQAEAAGIDVTVEMNPVLLKPTGNACSQVILMGKPVGNMSAREYHTGYSLTALDAVKESLHTLMNTFDVVVIEGAGSPAEVNLKTNDIVNMRVAKMIQSPVLLVADIDRGGALAAVVGTLELLEPEERQLIRGIVINKFRGDIALLKPALDFLEQKTGKRVLGVIPHIEALDIDDEDSVSLDDKQTGGQAELDIAVLRTPKISNFTDFDSLSGEPDVALRYISPGQPIGNPDLLILPGSKNTIEDLLYLRAAGYDSQIKALAATGTPIVGICGGYQMLGGIIFDPGHTESDHDSIEGLGLLSTTTTFQAEKTTHQVTFDCCAQAFLNISFPAEKMHGYEIHMGCTRYTASKRPPFTITSRSEQATSLQDGALSDNGLVMGTYIHGVFDNDNYRRAVLNALRQKKGLQPLDDVFKHQQRKQAAYDRLAEIVRQNIDMNLLYEVMN